MVFKKKREMFYFKDKDKIVILLSFKYYYSLYI